MKTCTKCGSTRFNEWDRCMDCRNARARVRNERLRKNGGKHTSSEWQALLNQTPRCPDCNRLWGEIPFRLDSRYQTVWTKDHLIPVIDGGIDDISNIRPLCYECNFKRHTKPIATSTRTEKMKTIRYTVKRGRSVGTVLSPHLHGDKHFVVSLSRFKKDYVRVNNEADLLDWVAKGYSVRMSNPDAKSHRSPSLISPGSIESCEV